MFALVCSLIRLLILPGSVREMALENLALRQQLTVWFVKITSGSK